MSEMLKITKSLCKGCRYNHNIGGNDKTQKSNSRQICSYILDVGHSRIFVDGVKVVPDGYCNTYEPRNGYRFKKPKFRLKGSRR